VARQPEARSGFDQARALLRSAREWYRAQGRTADEAYAANLIGNAFHYEGRWDEARTTYQHAVALYDRVPPTFRRAVVIQNLALLASDTGRADEAEELFHKAERLIAQFPQADMLATILENSGYADSILGRQDEALASYSRALVIRRAQGDSEPDVARCLMGIGVALSRTGDWGAASTYLEQAWDIRSRFQKQDRRGWLASGLAMIE